MSLARPLLLSFLFCLPFIANAQINFQEKEYSACVQNAATNSNPFMVYIHAEWCFPCELMDEGTFSDPHLSNTLGDQIDLYKIEYDSDLGLSWRQEFGIACLPTTLMFNVEGELIDRVESSYTAKECLSILASNELILEDNLVFLSNAVSATPEYKNNTNTSPSNIKSVQINNSISAIEELINSNTLSKEAQTELKYGLLLLRQELTIANTSVKVADTNTLFETTSPVITDQYEVQIGVFSVEGNAVNLSAKINSSTDKKAYIVQDFTKNKALYRVILGDYDQKQDAVLASHEIKEAGYNSFVKKR